jgi:hypothetical protein
MVIIFGGGGGMEPATCCENTWSAHDPLPVQAEPAILAKAKKSRNGNPTTNLVNQGRRPGCSVWGLEDTSSLMDHQAAQRPSVDHKNRLLFETVVVPDKPLMSGVVGSF